MDLNSRKVRCSASSMGSRWSNRREALPFLACFFRWVSLRIQSYDGLQQQYFVNSKHNQYRNRHCKIIKSHIHTLSHHCNYLLVLTLTFYFRMKYFIHYWIAMKYYPDIHDPHMMNLTEFGDPLSFSSFHPTWPKFLVAQ